MMTEIVSTEANEGCEACGEELLMTTEVVSTEGNERCGASGEGLLPGIPNIVTLAEIVPNLTWRECIVLSRVSSGWYRAIRSRQVYRARVRSNSTESMVLLKFTCAEYRSIAIYHMREKSCYELPPIPDVGLDVGRPIPWDSCQCVSLDGKIYVLGGDNLDGSCSDEVFVLDVAGQRKWKQCAPMKRPRSGFGCGVIGGKIYVCGGISSASDMMHETDVRQLPCDSEVYDPQRNNWSSIKPMIDLRTHHRVETVGEELLAHGGRLLDRRFFDSTGRRRSETWLQPRPAHHARSFAIYHPGTDEWRVAFKPSEDSYQEKKFFFGARGKFFSIDKKPHRGFFDIHQIHVLQAKQTSQTRLHSFTFEIFKRSDLYIVDVLPVDDELLAKMIVDGDCVTFLKSTGFGNQNEEIAWLILQYPSRLPDAHRYTPFARYPLNL